MTQSIDKLNESFNTIFIIISVFNIGIILSNQLLRVEKSPAAISASLFQLMVPIMFLIIIWWIAEFYDIIELRLLGWLILFTLVFYAIVFVMIMMGIDRRIGFNEIYLAIGYVLTPIPALFVWYNIKKRYCMLLKRNLTKKEKIITIILLVLFIMYWLIVPWDLSRLFN